MFHTGLDRYLTASVQNFTSDFGIEARRWINAPWRKILKLSIKRVLFYEELINWWRNTYERS